MSQSTASPGEGELELIGPVAPSRPRPGQVAELYRRGDQYLWVSTVPDLGDRTGLDAVENVFVEFGALGGYATGGEETMAFLADAEGNVLDWGEIAVATGPDSRATVLEELRTLPPGEQLT